MDKKVGLNKHAQNYPWKGSLILGIYGTVRYVYMYVL